MNEVLVTGATGFIGTALVLKLLDEGKRVTVIVPHENMANVFDSQLVTCIVCPFGEFDDLGTRFDMKCDVVYHLAWDGVSTELKNDYERQMVNVNYGLAVCRLAKTLGCSKVIFPGSVSEYAYSNEPVNGCQAPSPADAYGATKVATRVFCDLYARQNNLGFNWVLIPSIYGPGRIDNNLLSYTITSLLAGDRPVFTALEQEWDYLYITDLIEALYLVGEKGAYRKTYAVGSGVNKPLSYYVEKIRDLIDPGAELGIGELPYKTSHIDNSIVDISMLIEDTGFVPKVSFQEGIAAMIDYLGKSNFR